MSRTVEKPLRVGRYEILAELTRGGMGVVYRARDEAGREVVVKHLLPEAARRPHILRLFEREYETLSTLEHPRIIEVYEYGYEGGLPYYSMELLNGSDLRDLAPMPYREACSVLRDVASSLALLHARRLVHRDVSPRNIRRTENGRAKLIDFGAVTVFGMTAEVVGTAPCIAPEVLSGLVLDARSDLYALGVVAYFILTGRYPYPARDLAQLPLAWTNRPPAPSEIVPTIPGALDDLVLGLLRHDPMARPGSAAELIDRLTAIGDLEPESDPRVAESFLYTPPLVGREDELEKVSSSRQDGIGCAVARSRRARPCWRGRASRSRGAERSCIAPCRRSKPPSRFTIVRAEPSTRNGRRSFRR